MTAMMGKVGKRGTVVIPAVLRHRFGLDEGSLVIAEARDDGVLIRPAIAVPVEIYTPERRAEFLHGDYYFLEALVRYPSVASDVRPRTGEPLRLAAGPNPSHEAVAIELDLSVASPVLLQVLDTRGRVVRTVADDRLGPGLQRLDWDCRQDNGVAAPSGTYFCVLQAGRDSRVRKLTWLR